MWFVHYRITLQGILLSRDEVFLGIDAIIFSTPLEIDLFYQLRILEDYLECYFGDLYTISDLFSDDVFFKWDN